MSIDVEEVGWDILYQQVTQYPFMDDEVWIKLVHMCYPMEDMK